MTPLGKSVPDLLRDSSSGVFSIKELIGVRFYCYYLASAASNGSAIVWSVPLDASAVAHCETAAVETASTSVIMMIATSCAKLLASSFISCVSPLKTVQSFKADNRLSNVYASRTTSAS